MKHLLKICLVLLLTSGLARAQSFKPNDGDNIVFLGDSITHHALYTQYVEDFFYTRHPDKRLHFFNAGVGGDTAGDALLRFDADVAIHHPQYVFVSLGMNDAGYKEFDAELFANFQRDMTTLLDRIKNLGAKAIVLSPTFYDRASDKKPEQTPSGQPRPANYNSVLHRYGTWLRETATARDLPFADVSTPMERVTVSHRLLDDPDFTLFKKFGDGIHPDAAGHALIASALLKGLGQSEEVATIEIRDWGADLTTTVSGGRLENKRASEKSLSFDFTTDALPWILPPEAKEEARLLSRQLLRIDGLKKGKYALKIDGMPVGVYDSDGLARGLSLAGNPQAPQYQQALKVALLNKARNDWAVQPARWVWARTRETLPDEKEQGELREFARQAQFFEDWIYQTNQPQPLHFELTPVK